MFDYVLFDLDGTLTDPKEGITKSVQYALKAFGIEEEDTDNLVPFIGPPLKDSFMEFYEFDEEKAEQAIEKYRERFKDTGIFENRIYDGIPELIRKLKGNRKKLAVASSKPAVFVERILEHFDIRRYFDVVVGSELDGTRTDKAEVVEEALRQLYGENPEDLEQKKRTTVMVGDRKFDIAGAKEQGLISVAVAYGYGKMDELRIAKPDYTVRSVEELEKLLLKDTKKEVKEAPMTKIWYVLFPALVFFFVREMGAYIGQFIILNLVGTLPDALVEKIIIWDETGTMIAGLTGNGSAIIAAIAFIITGIVCIKFFAKDDISKAEKAVKTRPVLAKTPAAYVCMLIAVPAMVLGLNYLFELLGITNMSEAYKQTSEMQYAAAIPLALVVNGLLAPVVEEIIFRGVVFNRLKINNKFITSVIISALVFGVYHQNIVQGAYAFLMGCIIAVLYEWFGHFYVPVAVHVVSNVLVYLLTVTGLAAAIGINWWLCIGFLAIGMGMLLCCKGMHQKVVKEFVSVEEQSAE